MGIYDELKARGLIAQATDEEKTRELLNNGKATFYIGFDPTADSLHVGHFMQMVIIAHMQRAGHMPIALFGGGTAMVGDPSGRTDMRKMLSQETIRHNIECFKKQMSHIVDFSEGKALMLNNGDWLLDLNYIDFLRDIGVHFSVNRMLTFECFKSRLERGLSFLEFNYMLMQSYDFYKLFCDYGCTLELGGDDQWGNILAGTELIRKKTGKDAYGLTFTLLTNSEGKKMGKTQSGAVWLDPEKTSPFDFYQYWRNIADADVIKMLRMITFVPLEQIDQMSSLQGSELNRAKELLAFEVTKMVHGEEEAHKAAEAAKALFGSGTSGKDIPTAQLVEADFEGGKIGIIDLLMKSGIISTRGEGRRLIDQGGIFVNDAKVASVGAEYAAADFDKEFIIRKGKKTFRKITK
jgi:tyrosyl-tRNA synthetase